MKKLILIFITAAFIFTAGLTVEAAPVAQVPSPIHQLEPIPEGTHIDHTFIVKNPGDTVLKILNVLPP